MARRPLIGILAAAAGVLVGVFVLLSLPVVQRAITLRALNSIVAPGQEITVAGVGGNWPSEISLTGVAGRDGTGVWLTIDQATLRWRPFALLRGAIVVDSFTAGKVDLPRLPTGADRGEPPLPPNFAGIFTALGKINIGQATVDALSLGEPIVGQALVLRLTGSSQRARTHLEVQRTDAAGRAVFDLDTTPDRASLRISGALAGLTATGEVAMTTAEQLSGAIRVAREEAPEVAQVNARISGPRRTPTVDIDFVWSDFAVEGRPIARVVGTLRAAPTTPGGPYTLAGSGSIADLKQMLPEAAAVVTAEGKWSLNVTQATPRAGRLDSLRLDAGDAILEMGGAFTDSQVTDGRIALTVRGLGRSFGIANDLSSTQLTLGIDRLTVGGEGAGNAALAVNSLQNAPPVRIGARWAADTQSLRVTQLSGGTTDATLSGQSTWTRNDNLLDHRATSIDLTLGPKALGFGAGEPLKVAAKLEGALAALHGTVTAQSAQLGAPLVGPGDVSATLTARRNGAAVDADLQGSATWRGAPVTLTVQARKDEGPLLRIENLRGEGIAGQFEGAGAIDTVTGLTDGALSAKLADISVLAKAFGIDAKGALDGKLTLSKAEGRQHARADIQLARLVSGPLRAGGVTITGDASDAWRSRKFDVRLTSTPGIFLGGPVKAVTATVAGSADMFTAALKTEPAGRARFGFDVAADVTTGEPTVVNVTRLNLQDDGFTVALAGPAAVEIGRESITAKRIALAVADGMVISNIDIDRIKNTVAATIDAKDIAMAALAPPGYAIPLGKGAGHIVIGGAIGDATVNADLTAQFPADRQSATPAFSIAARIAATGGRLDLDARVEGLSAQPATLALDIPFRLDLNGPRIIVEDSAPITAAASWRGSIAPLWSLLPTDRHLLSGDVELDAKVSGTLAAPQIGGALHLAKGSYENIPGGTVLRNLDLRVSTDRGNDLVVTGSTTDAGSGNARFSGHLVRDAGGNWTVDVTADLDRLALVARDDVVGAASGKMSYTGPALGGVLKGNLAVVRGSINLDATGVPEVPLLRSWEFSKDDAPASSQVRPAPITFDVSLSMADPLRVEGRGLESAWRGELYIGGTLTKPDVSGAVTLDRGIFTFLGQSFELESGTVTFTGGGRIDPQLNVVAVREVADITATVNITGPTTAPTITLSSRPSLPQDEVLARLLFNRAAGELGPLESLQLASAAADMSGLARGGINGIMRRTFGLDTFSFGGQSGSAVVVGRQVSRNIFVSVEQSVNSTNRLFIITWRLTRHFSLRSSANDQTGADIGVFWRKDY